VNKKANGKENRFVSEIKEKEGCPTKKSYSISYSNIGIGFGFEEQNSTWFLRT
jgi:hypothetical protein